MVAFSNNVLLAIDFGDGLHSDARGELPVVRLYGTVVFIILQYIGAKT